MPATFCTCRTIIRACATSSTASAQCSTECRASTRVAQLRAERVAGPRARRAPAAGRRAPLGIVAVEAELGRRARRRTPCSTRAPACTSRRLVDDLVESRPRACCSRARPCAASSAGTSRAAPRAELHPAAEVELLASRSSSARCARSSAVQRRTVGLEPSVEPVVEREPPRAAIVSSPFAGESARARARAGARTGRASTQGNSARSIPCPIGTHLLRGERERAPVDAEHGRRDAARRAAASATRFQCVNQSSSGTPSGRTSGAASTA